jgi:hypothetical protein
MNRKWFSLWNDKSGAIAPLVAAMLPVSIGGAALAVDLGNQYISTQQLQTASDAGATDAGMLLLSQPTGSQLLAAAKQGVTDILTAGGFANTAQQTVSVSYTQTSVTVTLSAPTRNYFSVALGALAPVRTVTSTASLQQGSSCVLSLSNSSSGFVLSGSTSVNLVACAARSNGGYVMNGGSAMSASAVYADGNISVDSSASTGTTPLVPDAGTVADPFASDAALQNAMLAVSSVSGPTPKGNGGNQTVNLQPGNYSGMVFLNNSTVNLAPGTYYVNGDIYVNGGATINGSGVTIITKGTVNFSGGNINLSAPTAESGAAFPGILIADGSSSTQSIQGNSSSTLAGLVYTPNATIYVAGTAAAGSTTACFEVVAFTVDFTGNSTLNSNCSAYGMISLPANPHMVVLTQ